MVTYPTLLRYTPTAGTVGADTQSRGCIGNGRLFTMRIGNTGSDQAGLRSYNIANGLQVNAVDQADIEAAGGGDRVTSPMCHTPTGQIFVTSTGWFNGSAQVVLLDESFNFLSTWNDVDAGGGLPSLPYAPATPQNFGATSKQGVSYVACAPDATLAGQPVVIMQAGATGGGTTQFAGHTIAFTEAEALCCGSPAEVGKCFTIGRALPGPDSTDLGVYVTTISNSASNYNVASWPGSPNAHISTTKVGTVPVTSIDPTWTTTLGCTSPAYDTSDGNLLVMAATNDAGPAVKTHLFKIQASDAAVLWTADLPTSGINEIFNAMNSSVVTNGVFRFFCGSDQRFYFFDTSDGSVISNQHQGLGGAMTPLASIDYAPLDSVIYYGDWASNTPPPTPLGGISPSGTTFWYLLQNAAVPNTKSKVKWF